MGVTNERETRVLVAEDDPIVSAAMSEMVPIVDPSATVQTTDRVTRIEHILKGNRPPHLIVMDLELRDGHGETIFVDMRRHRLPIIPTIVMTATPMTPAEQRRLKDSYGDIVGAFIEKPFGVEAFKAAYRSTLKSPVR